MTQFSPLGSYVHRTGILHRIRPGAKLLALFAFAILVTTVRGPLITTLWFGFAVLLAIVGGMRWAGLWRLARGFSLIAIPLFLFQAWQHGWERGWMVVGSLLALVLAAGALTASTRIDDLLTTITWAMAPLRPIGVDPERVALAFSLTIRAVPSIIEVARETQAAARARGLERSMRARVVPLVLRTVAHAQFTGEALAARGLGDDEAPTES